MDEPLVMVWPWLDQWIAMNRQIAGEKKHGHSCLLWDSTGGDGMEVEGGRVPKRKEAVSAEEGLKGRGEAREG